jgi:DNA-binding transcriptional ArsR family regulator
VPVATRKPNPRPEPATITDPRAIKALAHPARLAVLEELHIRDELTATECAELVGLSPSAMSYHLRALEKWGFVERAAPSGDGRERPWRATSPTGWTLRAAPSPVAAAAESAVLATSFERLMDNMLAWMAVETTEPVEWQDVATLSNRSTWLTADESKQLVRLYVQFLDERRGRSEADRPAGARRVRTSLMLAPTPDAK